MKHAPTRSYGQPVERDYGKALIVTVVIILSLSCLSPAADNETSKALRRDSSQVGELSKEMGTGNLYALVVGISTYRNHKIPRLKLSDKDARDFAEFLKTQAQLFRGIDVHLLVNEEATEREVRKYLDYKLARATKDDTVMLFFSGHGATDPRLPGDFLFVPYDADPEFLASTAVNMTQSRFLKRLVAKRVILFVDACHAGGFFDAGTKNIQPPMEALLQQIRESEGKVILASSRDDEVSIEKPDLPNSIFTHYLLKGLKGEAADRDGIVALKNLYDYVHRRTVQETGGIQHPRLIGDLEGPFPLALTGAHAASLPAPMPAKATQPAVSPAFSDLRQKAERLVALSFTPGNGSDSKELNRLYKDPDAVKWIRQAAEEGDPLAQVLLGRMFDDIIDGIAKDYREAVKWYSKAAEQGHPGAQNNLGWMYHHGQGVARNYKKASEWYRKAAEQGNACAQGNLGWMYHNGVGVPVDYQETLKWWTKAAEQGNAGGMHNMGILYLNGQGVAQSREEAIRWFRKAAQLGYEDAKKKLRNMGVSF